MSACDDCRVRILPYLDNSLQGEELAAFRAHLEYCESCRASAEAERDFSLLLGRCRPLYSAPPALRARVATTIQQHVAAQATKSFWERVLRTLGSGWVDPGLRAAKLKLLAASLVVTTILRAFVPNFERHVRAADYVDKAIVVHRSYVDGNLPLEPRSNSPEQDLARVT